MRLWRFYENREISTLRSVWYCTATWPADSSSHYTVKAKVFSLLFFIQSHRKMTNVRILKQKAVKKTIFFCDFDTYNVVPFSRSSFHEISLRFVNDRVVRVNISHAATHDLRAGRSVCVPSPEITHRRRRTVVRCGTSAFSLVQEIIIAVILQHNNGQDSNVIAFALWFVVRTRERGGIRYKSVLY